MKKEINIKIKLYHYEELPKESRERAFNNHYLFLLQNPQDYETEDEDGNIITKYDNMEEWSQEEIKEYVEDSIEINNYRYFVTGEMAYITQYVYNHPKAGTTELKLYGETYII